MFNIFYSNKKENEKFGQSHTVLNLSNRGFGEIIMTAPQEKFMRAAIEEAIKAKENGDYAIGAVIVKDDKIIARSPNRTKSEQDPTQHAEVAVIRNAVKNLGHRHLVGCVCTRLTSRVLCAPRRQCGRD